jgi:hypothetical protein
MPLSAQLVWLFVLAGPVACVAWTVTHEELFAEVRERCVRLSRRGRSMLARKFFYVFTCEYCFSHYVAAVAVLLTGFRLLVDGWQGALLAWLAVVWVANVYMSLFVRLRLDIKRERVEINVEEQRAAEGPSSAEDQGRGPKYGEAPKTTDEERGYTEVKKPL